MGSLGVVMLPPLFNDDLRLFEGVKDFAVQQLIPQSGVEAFTIPVFPRRSWLDVGSLCADG